MFATVTCGCLRNDRSGYFIILGTCYFLFSVTKYITVHKLQKGSYNTKCLSKHPSCRRNAPFNCSLRPRWRNHKTLCDKHSSTKMPQSKALYMYKRKRFLFILYCKILRFTNEHLESMKKEQKKQVNLTDTDVS